MRTQAHDIKCILKNNKHTTFNKLIRSVSLFLSSVGAQAVLVSFSIQKLKNPIVQRTWDVALMRRSGYLPTCASLLARASRGRAASILRSLHNEKLCIFCDGLFDISNDFVHVERFQLRKGPLQVQQRKHCSNAISFRIMKSNFEAASSRSPRRGFAAERSLLQNMDSRRWVDKHFSIHELGHLCCARFKCASLLARFNHNSIKCAAFRLLLCRRYSRFGAPRLSCGALFAELFLVRLSPFYNKTKYCLIANPFPYYHSKTVHILLKIAKHQMRKKMRSVHYYYCCIRK